MADRSALYSTIATVLPLFALALLAERRIGVRERSTDPGLDALLAICLICAAAIGEFGALSALAGNDTHGNRVSAELGLGLAGVVLFADMVWTQVAGYRATTTSRWRLAAMTTFGLTLIGVGALLLGLFWIADGL